MLFYLKGWASLDDLHTKKHNINLPKETTTAVINQKRPAITDTHKDIQKLKHTKQDKDKEIIDDTEIGISQLLRMLTQWKYSIKSKQAQFLVKNQKVGFKTFEEENEYFKTLDITKHQLCSLIHSFNDQSYPILAQTKLFRIHTWKCFHEITSIDWDDIVPLSIKNLSN